MQCLDVQSMVRSTHREFAETVAELAVRRLENDRHAWPCNTDVHAVERAAEVLQAQFELQFSDLALAQGGLVGVSGSPLALLAQ